MRTVSIFRLATAAIVLALAGSAFVAVAGAGVTAEVESESTLELRPAAISTSTPTPVSLVFTEQIGSSDGSHVSPLQELRIDLDRRLAIDLRGVPRCHPGFQIDNPRGPEADPCPSAKIGFGWVEVEVLFPEQPPIPVTSRVAVYNGGFSKGVTTLFLHTYFTAPVSGAIILTAKVSRETAGLFGTKMAITVPKIAGNGAITYLRFRLRKGIATATCPGGRLWAGVSARLADSSVLSGLTDSRCMPIHKTP